MNTKKIFFPFFNKNFEISSKFIKFVKNFKIFAIFKKTKNILKKLNLSKNQINSLKKIKKNHKMPIQTTPIIITPGTGLPITESPSIQSVLITLEVYTVDPLKRIFPTISTNTPLKLPIRGGLINVNLEEQILLMKLQEIREIHSIYSNFFNNETSYPQETPIKLRITLLNIEEKQVTLNPWDITEDSDRLEHSNLYKVNGNELLKKNCYNEANTLYNIGLNLIEHDTGEKFESIRGFLSSNLILGCLKGCDYKKAKEISEKLLKNDGNNVKIRFRRALAEIGLGEFESAKEDLLIARGLEPDNKEILKELDMLKEKEKIMKDKAKAIYSKMFGGK